MKKIKFTESCEGEKIKLLQNENHRQIIRKKPSPHLLEFALILLQFGNNLPSALIMNEILKQTCFQYGYENSICDILNQNQNTTKEIEKEVQPYAANIRMTVGLFHSSVPAVLSLFLGPWSDTFGRKTSLNLSILGYALTFSSFAVVSYVTEYINPLSPWIYALCYIPAVVFGDWPSFLAATLCYIADTCDGSRRSYHLVLIEMIIVLGGVLGSLSCSAILAVSNSFAVFAVAAVFIIIATIIIIFYVEESIDNVPINVKSCDKINSLISPKHITEMFQTCFKQRSFKERRILLCLILILGLNRFSIDGNLTVGYLFERLQFNWTLEDHNTYYAINIILTIFGSVIGISFLKKRLNFSDLNLLCLALLSFLIDSILKAFAFKSWHMFFTSSLSMLRVISNPLCRSLISSIVPHNEIGKIFSLTTTFEALNSFVSPPLFTLVYESTYATFAGAIFLISAAACVINICLAFYIKVVKANLRNLMQRYMEINGSFILINQE